MIRAQWQLAAELLKVAQRTKKNSASHRHLESGSIVNKHSCTQLLGNSTAEWNLLGGRHQRPEVLVRHGKSQAGGKEFGCWLETCFCSFLSCLLAAGGIDMLSRQPLEHDVCSANALQEPKHMLSSVALTESSR